jgi:hypothetical protein
MAVEDVVGALGIVCPTEAAACNAACQTQIQQAATSDAEPDFESMSAQAQAALGCFGSSIAMARPAELAEQGDNGGLLALSVISCSISQSASLRPCFPPARAPPEVRTVAARVLTATEVTETRTAVASKLAEARAAATAPEQNNAPAPPKAE